jgi:hypothetical protein
MCCVSHLSNIRQGVPVLRLIWQRSQYLGYECILSILRICSVVIVHQTLVVIWNIICCSNVIRSFSKVEFKFCNNIWKQILTFKYMSCYICVCLTSLPFLPYSKNSLPWKVKNYLVSFPRGPQLLIIFFTEICHWMCPEPVVSTPHPNILFL